jgi:hypothetical protein
MGEAAEVSGLVTEDLGRLLVAGASQDGEGRVLAEAGVAFGEAAEPEDRVLAGDNALGVSAGEAEADALLVHPGT